MEHLHWNDTPLFKHSCILIIIAWMNTTTTTKKSVHTYLYVKVNAFGCLGMLSALKIQSHNDCNTLRKGFHTLHICLLHQQYHSV